MSTTPDQITATVRVHHGSPTKGRPTAAACYVAVFSDGRGFFGVGHAREQMPPICWAVQKVLQVAPPEIDLILHTPTELGNYIAIPDGYARKPKAYEKSAWGIIKPTMDQIDHRMALRPDALRLVYFGKKDKPPLLAPSNVALGKARDLAGKTYWDQTTISVEFGLFAEHEIGLA